ncbi:hypothetical protein VPH35_054412 [Triticum aestivum]
MRKMGKTEPSMPTGQFRRVLSWEETHQSSSTGGDEGQGRGQRRGGGRGYACGHRLRRRRDRTIQISLLPCLNDMLCFFSLHQQAEEIQSQFCSAVASSTDNKSAQQPDVQDRFSKLSQLFEQLDDSYNHFSLALLHVDNLHHPITVCSDDRIDQFFLE